MRLLRITGNRWWQALPSLQLIGALMQPVAGSHESVVQAMLSCS